MKLKEKLPELHEKIVQLNNEVRGKEVSIEVSVADIKLFATNSIKEELADTLKNLTRYELIKITGKPNTILHDFVVEEMKENMNMF